MTLTGATNSFPGSEVHAYNSFTTDQMNRLGGITKLFASDTFLYIACVQNYKNTIPGCTHFTYDGCSKSNIIDIRNATWLQTGPAKQRLTYTFSI